MTDEETVYRMRLEQELKALDDLRCAMVMLGYEIDNARGKVSDTDILDAVRKAIKRNLSKYNHDSSGVIV